MTRAERLYQNNREVNVVVNAAEFARKILANCWSDPELVLRSPSYIREESRRAFDALDEALLPFFKYPTSTPVWKDFDYPAYFASQDSNFF
jgi:hypothetical protein